MASFKKTTDRRWQAQVARLGVRKSKTFDTKQAAKDWATREENLILAGEVGFSPATLGDAMEKYAKEISSTKRGERWEIIRLRKFGRDPLAKRRISSIKAADIAVWRDHNLKTLAPASVHREMELLSGVFNVARKEWGWIDRNPMEDVRRPRKPLRDRRVAPAELDALAQAAGDDLAIMTARTFHAFLFAIETAMRSGEIVSLRWEDINLSGRVAHLPMTKNGTSRNVPLSREAVRLLEGAPKGGPGFWFG